MEDPRIRRRAVLGFGLASVSGSVVGCRRDKTTIIWRCFTAAEARTVDAICERLIPADDDPGAREARVVNYIDLQLTRRFRRHRRLYREGIAAVNEFSRSRFGSGFADLSADSQVEVLTEVERTSSEFFNLILEHTRQGFYGDPRHGGNRNRVSWKMLRLPLPPLRGRQANADEKVV